MLKHSRTLAVLLAAGLAITACDAGTSLQTGPSTTAAPTTTTTAETPKAGSVNKPFKSLQNPNDDVTITIREMTFGQPCRYGELDPTWGADFNAETQQILQVWAEVEVLRVADDAGPFQLSEPLTLDSEGFTTGSFASTICEDPTDKYGFWFDPTYSGTKTRRYGAFVVPKDVAQLTIEGVPFEVTTG